MNPPPIEKEVSEVLRELALGIANDRRKLLLLRNEIELTKGRPFEYINHIYRQENSPPA